MPVTDALIYQIRVQGQLDASWSEWLGGLTITLQPDGTTVLYGSIVDQAALHGLLDRLYGLNLPILSVVQIKDEAAK